MNISEANTIKELVDQRQKYQDYKDKIKGYMDDTLSHNYNSKLDWDLYISVKLPSNMLKPIRFVPIGDKVVPVYDSKMFAEFVNQSNQYGEEDTDLAKIVNEESFESIKVNKINEELKIQLLQVMYNYYDKEFNKIDEILKSL